MDDPIHPVSHRKHFALRHIFDDNAASLSMRTCFSTQAGLSTDNLSPDQSFDPAVVPGYANG